MKCIYQSSVIGKLCKENQDEILIHETKDFSVHGVFDGIQSRKFSGEFTSQLVALLEQELMMDSRYSNPDSISKLLDKCRKNLATRFPAAGCSFLVIINAYHLPYRFFLWAGDCRLGRIRNQRLVWITDLHTKSGVLTNRLLAKRACIPSVGVIDKKRCEFILASDGFWSDNKNDDTTVIKITATNA
jgi:serine/threonine protein phosphatase PrpC